MAEFEKPVGRRIHRYERTRPKQYLVAHRVQFGNHALGVAKASAVELPDAVIGLPRIVNHEDAGRNAVIQHRPGVCEDAFFVLIVSQFDPGVQLRRRKILHHGQFTGRRKPLLRGMAECVGKRPPRRFIKFDRARVGDDRDLAVDDLDLDGACAPDDPSLVGNEQRH